MTRIWTWLIRLGANCAGFAATPAAAQALGQAHEPEISLWRVVGAVVFCCLLGAAGALALKYRMHGRAAPARGFDTKALGQLFAGVASRPKSGDTASERLRVVETVHLGYQVEVALLDCDGAAVMIVTGPHGAFVVNPKTEAAP